MKLFQKPRFSMALDDDDIKPNIAGDDTMEHDAAGGDDPVIHEIPVYLSKSLNCYVLQYPVRPATMPYDNVEVAGEDCLTQFRGV